MVTKRARGHGVVVPHQLNWGKRVVAALIYALIRVVGWSLRWRWELHPKLADIKEPLIFVTWHNRLSLSLLMYLGYARIMQKKPRLAAMVSASKDGAVVARILEHFGMQPVRGSTSRRGPQALLELTSLSEQGYDLAITPDGPRGPRYVLQSGPLFVAQLTGRAIVPASNYVRWKICVKSWDRFQIPLPFSRAEMRFGEPLRVPREATEEEREQLREELERRVLALTVD